ncbi:MAG: Protein UshA [Candidatus Marinimicrobia bacterium]|nr:Protein UshA [Candidatus Neomarinimicrobiota bacterium]
MSRWFFLIIIVAVVFPVSIDAEEQIHILFTSNSNGKIENCNCPDIPYGALERRAEYIAKYKEQYPETIVLDNGDNFLHGMREEEKSLVTRIFSLIPYDLINVGDQDVAFGNEANVSSTGIVREQGTPVLIERGDTKISVLPVAHPATTRFYADGTFKELPFDDPLPQIEQWVQDINGKGVLAILLSHSGYEQDVEYARQFPEITLIIGGHSQTVIDTVNLINGVAVQQAGGNAEYVGEIIFARRNGDFEITSYQLHPMNETIGAHPEVAKWIERYHQTYPRK